MAALFLTLLIPLVAAIALAFVGGRPWARHLNAYACLGGLLASLWLAWSVLEGGPVGGDGSEFYVDAFSVYLLALTALVGWTTAIFSGPYMANEEAHGRVTPHRMRLYHASFQGFLLAMQLAQSTNNLGILWVAMEGATLATVLLVSLYRTPQSVEAAWKYFILCGVGIAQALFGTVLVYFAAAKVLPDPELGLLWSVLNRHAAQLDPVTMALAFVFLLVGYGTKVGLVPLHNWLPDAHSEGPTPMSAVLSGLLLNVALYALVRVKMLVDGALAAAGGHPPQLAGYLMMGFGLLSFLVASLYIHRQRDIKRLFSYSSIEHMGLMTFAFGVGGPLATFGALLHMTVHSLTKSAIFITVGHASQIARTQAIEQIRGLIQTQPAVGWGLAIGTAVIAGFPPFGVFTSEFLLLSATMQSWPWLTLPLLVGMVVALAGLLRHLQPMVYGSAPEGQRAVSANMWPVALHLALVLWLGLAIPGFLSHWFDQATQLIAGKGLL
ncbi:MAG TPA: hydrogenase 4 subunit F [Candidatus Competibacteraceae bacterium]|nr:hydrogenase 4 subunit F [Candidatus Competibacteraceae bacterium]